MSPNKEDIISAAKKPENLTLQFRSNEIINIRKPFINKFKNKYISIYTVISVIPTPHKKWFIMKQLIL